MKQIQMNRKHMVDTTLAYLDENAIKWQSIAKIGEVKNQLNALSIAIDEAAQTQESVKVNMGKLKIDVKRSIAQKADIVNDLLEVFAIMSGDGELSQKMGDSASDLFKMKNADMLLRVKTIIAAATENQEALVAEYGLTAEQITDLQSDYDRFLELNDKPREYIVKKAMATQELEQSFGEVNELLTNKLDNLMKIFKRRDASFYNGYLKARMVVDY